VVFELRQHDFVALTQVLQSPGIGDEIECFGGILGKDHFLPVSVNEVCHPLMCLLVSEGRFFTQNIHAAVDIGVGGLIVVTHGVKDLERFLGRRGAIEVDERTVMYATCQNGKITTQCIDIQPSLTLERGYIGHVMTLNMAWEGSMSRWPVVCLC
jgi:hypothetical protein